MSKFFSVALLGSLAFAVGCQSSEERVAEAADSKPMKKEQVVEAKAGPEVLFKKHDAVFFKHDGRLYIVSEAMAAKFEKHGHLPYARTKIGEGPQGETLVFEINKKNPSVLENLEKAYAETPILLSQQGDDFYVFAKDGRKVIIGSSSMAEKFQKHGHIPYAKTLIGAGAQGETLVYEIDKKNPAMTDRLMATYNQQM